MVLSTRVSLQWVPETPEELTNTLVFTSPQNHFVDVRIFKHKYPYRQAGELPERFEDVFEWAIVGEEEDIENTNQTRFNHTVNLQEITRALALNRPLSECKSLPDVGTFWPIEGSEDRKETGSMANPKTGKVTEYVEIWRSLNSGATTVAHEVREGYDESGQKLAAAKSHDPVMVFDLKKEGYIGRIVRLGNWVQGVVYNGNESTHPLSIMRRVYDPSRDSWADLIVYGSHAFPEVYLAGRARDEWVRIE